MRSLLLLMVLLCMSCVAQAHTKHSTHTLRLCGRAFLRAVVYTCGGSRWKRLMGQEETLPDSKGLNFLRTRDVVPALNRQRQDLTQALTTVCCQLGCRTRDLAILC